MEPQDTQGLPQPADQISDEEMKAASRSLADALHVSFRLLSALMILVVGLFLFSGWRQIDQDERGVRLLFGQILGDGDQRVLEPGLKFSWPEPIGRILTVSAKEAKLAVNEFWMFESPDKPLTPRGEGAVSTEGLRPGWDGALLTGDRALVHVKLTCLYRVGTRGGSPDAERVLDYVSNVADAEKLIEAAVCNGAIRAAGARTADSVYRAETEAFKAEVAKFAQQRLDEVGSGIEIQSIQLDATVPLATIKAFNDVQNARQERENEVNEAKTEAIKILNGAAGKDWATLVGDREKAAKAATTAKTCLLYTSPSPRD